jgi:hypothetical protein
MLFPITLPLILIAACVNTDGTITGPIQPTPCYTLFHSALSGVTPLPSGVATSSLGKKP